MVNKGFVSILRHRCQKAPGRVGFAESMDARILQVAAHMLADGTAAEVTLFSPRTPTLALAREQAINLEHFGTKVRWALSEAKLDTKATLASAADMLNKGELDAVLAGNLATTAEVIRAGIGGLGLAPGVRTVSGAFLMNREQDAKQYLFADCGVVIAPTVKQLVDIASESVRTWSLLFAPRPPVVAFLSYSTKGSAQHESALKIAEAATAFRAMFPDVISDGELQFDAAFDESVGQRKAPGSEVPGKANIFVFPDLGAGNIAYKLAQRLGGFEAYGPVLQGLAKPFNDLSRGATVADILASAYVSLLRRTPGTPL